MNKRIGIIGAMPCEVDPLIAQMEHASTLTVGSIKFTQGILCGKDTVIAICGIGKVYDEEYRVLSKSALTGAESPIGEILLGGAERVYCFGEQDAQTSAFLEKYYGENAVFC